jgi:hypothetical protein
VAVRNSIQRRLRRAKDSERDAGRWAIKHDGPDPRFRPGAGLVSTTGRVGHVTGLQFDTLSRTYAGENKHEKVPATWWKYWVQVCTKAVEHGKQPWLRVDPTNDDDVTVNGRPVPIIHMITEERHAELLAYERAALEGAEAPAPPAPQQEAPRLQRLAESMADFRPYPKEVQTGRAKPKARAPRGAK